MGPFEFEIQRELEIEKNTMDEPIIEWAKAFSVVGYLDLLTGDVAHSSNSFIEESSHIFIVFDTSEDITNDNRIYNPRTKLSYEITFVDNPMELDSHYEIYCKKVA